MGEIQFGEIGIIQQRVVQRIHRWQHVEPMLAKLFDQARYVAWIGYQNVHTTDARTHKAAYRQSEDVIKR